jgi:hypothetical protein
MQCTRLLSGRVCRVTWRLDVVMDASMEYRRSYCIQREARRNSEVAALLHFTRPLKEVAREWPVPRFHSNNNIKIRASAPTIVHVARVCVRPLV